MSYRMVASRWSSLLLLNLLLFSVWAQDNCGSIGNSDESELSERNDMRFYLNTANPAPCTGNITSWRVCYYGPGDILILSRRSYLSVYAVYRRMGSGGSERYERVSEIFTATVTTSNIANSETVDAAVQQNGFTCFDDFTDSPVMVQAGDIVGACVFRPPDFSDDISTRQLDVVGEINGESLEGLSDADGCDRDRIPSNIQASDLSTRNSRRLHIYANIVSTQQPTTTEATVATTTPMSTTTAEPTTTGATVATTTPMIEGPTSTAGETSQPGTTQQMSTTRGATTSPLTPGNADSGGSFPTGTIVGVLIGVLLTLVLLVAIVVVVLCLVRRRQASSGYSMRITKDGKNVNGIDNLIYGKGDGTLNNRASNLEASLYEVPVNGSATLEKSAEHIYEYTETTPTDPNMYEYATSGPNGEGGASPYSEAYYSPLDEATISYAKLMEKNKEEDIYGSVDVFLQPASEENELYAQLKAHGITNISSNLIEIHEHLGSGQFGSVERGSWRNGTKSIEVALKLLKEGSSEMDRTKFLQEAAIMAQFRHPNVISLYGVVSKTDPMMLVVEFAQRGDLRKYLHTMRPDPGELPVSGLSKVLLSFCQQVALGMQYLSAKGFVHRDLAARNILVTKDNICKVADFGMSRDLADETYYVSQGGKVPVKWTAPEAINYKKYSTASDIWSYGCLLYEIWSVGFKPFDGVNNSKVIELVDSGIRLPPPPGSSKVVYELMIKCWNPRASDRPTFRQILLTLLSRPADVLSIPQQDLDSHPFAGVLGSPLEVGEKMYQDLQKRYVGADSSDYQTIN